MGTVQAIVKFAEYVAKPGKKLLINANPAAIENFACKFVATEQGGQKIATMATRAKLGDASLHIEKLLRSSYDAAKVEMNSVFGNLSTVEKMSTRPKGALSIYTKLEKGIQKAEGQTFNCMDDAIGLIEDGIGTRVITNSLPKLSRPDIDRMVSELTIEGEKLSAKQKELLYRYIDGKSIPACSKDEAFRLFEQFAQPLIEKRSCEVVDELTLGILQHRINIGELKLAEIEGSGLFGQGLIEKLKIGNIKPINITEINNYRGKYGLPEFSNAQIQNLSAALGFKNPNASKVKIISDPRGLEYMQYPPEKLKDLGDKSVKASGYRTAQMNVIHENGMLGELQFRGRYTNMIGEYEHIAYDLRQGKDTLGPMFDDFKKAIKRLNKEQYAEYNEYLEKCYNYYNRLELGLPATKPKIPKGLGKILSEENLKALHDKNEILEAQLKIGFKPHIEYAA